MLWDETVYGYEITGYQIDVLPLGSCHSIYVEIPMAI